MPTLNDKVRRANPIQAYLARHLQVAVAALGRIARAPLASLLTVLVISITLALPAALHLLVKNALLLSGGWESAVDFSVYFEPGLDEDTATQLAAIIEKRGDVASVEFIGADEALEEFRKNGGFAAALDGLDSNPLPHALVVRPDKDADEATIRVLKEDLQNLPETDLVQLDTEWVQRFLAILDVVRRGVTIAAVLLAVAVVIVIGNTVRLDIQNRQQEIVVTKLVGASNGFIRRPFLYSGLLYGFLGGVLALALIWITLTLMGEPVRTLAGLYASGFALKGLSLKEAGLLVAAGGALGWLGSWIATARHLRRIEPR